MPQRIALRVCALADDKPFERLRKTDFRPTARHAVIRAGLRLPRQVNHVDRGRRKPGLPQYLADWRRGGVELLSGDDHHGTRAGGVCERRQSDRHRISHGRPHHDLDPLAVCTSRGKASRAFGSASNHVTSVGCLAQKEGAKAIQDLLALLLLRARRATGDDGDRLSDSLLALALILLAYREVGWLALPHTSHALELRWVAWDRVVLRRGLKAAIEALGPVLPSILEIASVAEYRCRQPRTKRIGTDDEAIELGGSRSRVIFQCDLLFERPLPLPRIWRPHSVQKQTNCQSLPFTRGAPNRDGRSSATAAGSRRSRRA